MEDHYDHNQTLVPESFLALHSRHGRALRPRAEIESRHELCEDVALHAAAFIAARHQEGDDEGEALQRCRDGAIAALERRAGHDDDTGFAEVAAPWPYDQRVRVSKPRRVRRSDRSIADAIGAGRSLTPSP